MSKKECKPYKIIGAYDSETTNLVDESGKHAFPILHQLGTIGIPIDQVTSENVEHVTELHMYRHTLDLYNAIDFIAAGSYSYVPVICCHNLSFDMYGLAAWLAEHEVKVLAKSQRKPISFTVIDDFGEPCLVMWDTLVFAQKGLEYMGNECGYPKLAGDWDYDLIRTPGTPLTADEEAYAAHDIYALLAWLGYWCRLNPDISINDLALRVVSKTGVVRRRRVQRFASLKGSGCKKTVGQFWSFINAQNAFDDDDELYTCQAATRGGFTFCASENASRVFDFRESDHTHVYGFDATSQHPSQMVCHRYPVRFSKATADNLDMAFKCIELTNLDDFLAHYEKPFGVAFYAAFEFKNLRVKEGSLFKRYGITPLAYARCSEYRPNGTLAEENQQGEEFREHLADIGYKDKVVNPTYSFGKLESADTALLWITELTAWEIAQAYDYDAVSAVSGYISMSFDKPSDMCVISVMQFYAAKNAFKRARSCFYSNKPLSNSDELLGYGIPEFVVSGMENHSIDDSVVESTYLGLKADLNALFGIEACNEYRRDTVLTASGIEYTGDFGVVNAPNQSKAWYQLGQRIVGWSRIAQCIVMMLCNQYIETVVNGDTDSVKFVIKDENLSYVTGVLERMNTAIDKAKHDVCSRVKRKYNDVYDSLDGIGYYVLEFTASQFCASWNKAYCVREYDPRDGEHHIHFTLAGVPSREVDKLADKLMGDGWGFGDICDTFLGYNVTYSHDITGLNARAFPEWGSMYTGKVTDYRGETHTVVEPSALCLYPMAKTVNDVQSRENLVNMAHAVRNRPQVSTEPTIISRDGIKRVDDIIYGD